MVRGVVYSIRYKDDVLYVGSTENYNIRTKGHLNRCYNEKSNKYNYPIYVYIRDNNIKFCKDMFHVEEEFEYTEEQKKARFLQQQEQLYIEKLSPKCNTMDAYTPLDIEQYHKEQYKQNRDKILESSKQYYKEHKEQVQQYKKQYREKNKEKLQQKYYCDVCKKELTKNHQNRHESSQKHQNNLKQNIHVHLDNFNNNNIENLNIKIEIKK